jgi:hypothetical protein
MVNDWEAGSSTRSRGVERAKSGREDGERKKII